MRRLPFKFDFAAAVVLVVVLLVFVDVTFLVSGFEGADGLKSATMR